MVQHHLELLKARLALRSEHLEHLGSSSPDTNIAEEDEQEESRLFNSRRLRSSRKIKSAM